jgi:acyl transferase domain-containing protein
MSDEEKIQELTSVLHKAAVAYEKVREELDSVISEPIAIIGMACRLPGNVNSPDDFWKLLIENKDAIIEIPSERWDLDAYYDANKNAPGKMYVRKGGFLQTPIDEFDAEFFHISRREAEDMDPQQRIALEVAWQALENAGIHPNDLKQSPTGVYMGLCFNDYGHLITESHHLEAVDNYYSTGNHYSVLSGRISYYFGFQGPALSIDTACSSSLVTIDEAVKDLRLKRCNLALAGGVNLMLAPEPTINFCKSGMLSPEGYCKAFDASADGYVRGEGCGILVLKPLKDAIADKNIIYAIIRGSAVNQDGASGGLTVPNGLAQEEVIKSALRNARTSPLDLTYVEAHGTGTPLGDPIELEALRNVYAKERPADKPLYVGSVKSNIGHTEAVAGVASVIKVILSFLNEKIPATLHFKTLNPAIDLSKASMKIAEENRDWKRGTRRLAGVSSFGFSGTNAHLILEEGPPLSDQDRIQLQERARNAHQFNRQHYWAEVLRVAPGKIKEKLSLKEESVVTRDELGKSLEKTEEKEKVVRDYLIKLIKQVLKAQEEDKIDIKKGFFEMGMDSLMAVELVNTIQQALGDRCQVEPTAAFDYPSISKLTDYVLKLLGYDLKEKEIDVVDEEISKLSLEDLLKEAEGEDSERT